MTAISSRDERSLLRAVHSAVRAPSVHNTQPWRFVVTDSVLDVYADPGRQLSMLDPTGRQLYLSLGCALMNARVSLAASGNAAQVTRFPDALDPQHVASIALVTGESVDADLAELDGATVARQSNRLRFSPDPVPDELVATLIAAAAREGATLHPVIDESDRQTLARLSQRADLLQIADPAYRAELREWTTTDPERRDGVRAAAVPHVDGSSGDEVPIRDFDSQGAGGLPSETQSLSSQCLLVLGTAEDSPESWLRAGEALERVWLEITRAGYAASLFTQAIEVGALRAELQDELRLGMRAHVVIRVGRARATAATLRREIADVLSHGNVAKVTVK